MSEDGVGFQWNPICGFGLDVLEEQSRRMNKKETDNTCKPFLLLKGLQGEGT